MRRSVDAFVYGFAAAAALIAVGRPLWSAHYPPITDLPFHAAHTSIFRHYGDPAFCFREQFELQPFAVPYVSSYVLGALLMLVFSAPTAVKLATGVMLLMLPAGLATLSWGMRKTPLLGILGVPFAWCHLVHWGFINFVAAIGLFAMAVGLALRAADVPSRRTEALLSGVLVLLFFTHVFRFPFAVSGVVIAVLVTYPAHRRLRPILWPLAAPLAIFAVWWIVRPAAVSGTLGPLDVELARWDQLARFLVDGFDDPAEMAAAKRHAWIVAVLAAALAGLAARRFLERQPEERRFGALAALAVALLSALFFGLYLSLPIEIGVWWYIYPREATAFAFVLMALVPDLPARSWARAAVVGVLGLSSLSMSDVVAKNYAAFDATTRDFDRVAASIPPAPKLAYLVFDHSGSTRTTTPYIHLPAWIQADRGGWLSFHFAIFGTSPVRYRHDPGAVVPPPVPRRWEWTPNKFRVLEHGTFFDWFLVRSEEDPAVLFEEDPSIDLVAHGGRWWLYGRR